MGGCGVRNMGRKELRVVRLLEPDLCSDCRFARRAEVELRDGRIEQMIYCRRLDCDNWDYSSAEPALRVNIVSDEE